MKIIQKKSSAGLNMKSQMNQIIKIEYEFETLELLKNSGVTPKPYKFVTTTGICHIII